MFSCESNGNSIIIITIYCNILSGIILTILPAATEGRLQAEVDVLLGVEADNEGGDVDNLQHGAGEGSTWLGEVTWSVTPHADPAPDTCGQRVMLHDSGWPRG